MTARLSFDFEWRITLFTLLLLPLLISLGFWQLQRAGEKAALAAAFERQQASPPALLQTLVGSSAVELAYRPVVLRGRFAAGQDLLLDNRTRSGRYGNEVLSVFALDDGALALVNRGWLPADPARRVLPDVPDVPGGSLEIRGLVYVAPGEPYLLADEPLARTWPQRIQAVEMDKIAAVVDGALFPYPVRIQSGEPGALQADWQVVNVSPAKHRGYAVQWFSMAAVLAMLYLLRSTNVWQVIKGFRSGTKNGHDD
jgi:cytochrome oxidase assembly protein ShyY1